MYLSKSYVSAQLG